MAERRSAAAGIFAACVAWGRSRNANISMMLAILAVPVTLAAGGGIDLALNEHARIRLQNALDSSLIAAASVSQPMPAEETVRSYLDAAKITGYTLDVSEVKTAASRTVTATARLEQDTHFLRLIDIPTLNVMAMGRAEEAFQNIELSLVLDLSGSMRGSRINAMRPAAKNFVSQLLTEKSRDFTSISIIPYAGQVSMGAAAFDAFGGKRTHDRSSCFGNLDLTYQKGIPDLTKAEHVPQFSSWIKGTNSGFDPWNCPTEETSITYFSNNVAAMHAAIDGYRMFDGTATHIAAKWGFHLLDPDFKPWLLAAKASGLDLRPAIFADRPSTFFDKQTQKIMVIMTDGEVVAQQRPVSGKPVNDQPDSKSEYTQKVSAGQAMNAMTAACTDAKSKGIIIYAIGFEVSTGSFKDKLRGCASGDGRYYDAKANNLDAIFQDVARSIHPLRLTN